MQEIVDGIIDHELARWPHYNDQGIAVLVERELKQRGINDEVPPEVVRRRRADVVPGNTPEMPPSSLASSEVAQQQALAKARAAIRALGLPLGGKKP